MSNAHRGRIIGTSVERRERVQWTAILKPAAAHPLSHLRCGRGVRLDILGVEREIIVEDYVLTASRMDLILARFRRSPNDTDWVASIPQFLLRAEASTMQHFLELVDLHHGGARAWARAAGVSEGALEAMSALLVRSPPAP